jgi:7-cyano-7-deazaguanine tRNA-ribosyltransferase
MFEIIAKEGLGRLGKLVLNGKTVNTPTILPVVHPRSQIISPADMYEKFGVEAVFTNAYIIWKDEALARAVMGSGGVHEHLGFPGIIATDSGAFQHYMYGTDDLRADVIEPFQENIGSDLGVILDQPVQIDDPRDVAAAKVDTTIRRAADNVQRRASPATSWYGPIHGARFPDLIERSALAMNAMEFDVHAVGGVVKLFNQYEFSTIARIVLSAKKTMDPSRPVHLFGAGHPMVFALFVALGCDMFDSAAYSLFAKEGRYITAQGTLQLDTMTEFPCSCPACAGITPKELLQAPEQERFYKLAIHNLHATMNELRLVRESIRAESLWQLVEARCRHHPKLLEALRVAEQVAGDEIAAEEPVYKARAVLYTGPETLSRPDVASAREQLDSRYAIPDAVSTVVIFPELDISPVASPQHARWLDVIAETASSDAGRAQVLVAYLSPLLGIVPEDLVQAWPGSQNIVPLVLDRDQEEMMEASALAFLEKVRERKIVLMVPLAFESELGVETAFEGTFLAALGKTIQERFEGVDLRVVHDASELRSAMSS